MKKYLIVGVVLFSLFTGSVVSAETSKITAFSAKDFNVKDRSVTLVWNANGAIDVNLEVLCKGGSIQFKTEKGNNPICDKGGIWSWDHQKDGSITVYPYGNKQDLKVDFLLNKNGDPFTNSWKETVVIPKDPNYNNTVPVVVSVDPRDQKITDLQSQINALLAQIAKLKGDTGNIEKPYPIEYKPVINGNSLNLISPNGNTYKPQGVITVGWSQNYDSKGKITATIVSSKGGVQYYHGSVGQGYVGKNATDLPAEASNIPNGYYTLSICDEETPVANSKVICSSAEFLINDGTYKDDSYNGKKGADLIVKDIYTGQNYLSGDNVNKYPTVSAIVCNQGDTATPNPKNPAQSGFYTQFLFSETVPFLANGKVPNYGLNYDLKGNLIWPDRGVQPGECVEARAGIPWSFGLSEGKQDITVTADEYHTSEFDNRVTETNENNNSLTKQVDLRFKDSIKPVETDTKYSIVLDRPVTGDNWEVGKTYQIKWKSKGDLGPRGAYLYDINTYAPLYNLGETNGNGNSLKYTVASNIPAGKYMLTVCSQNFCPAIGGSSSAIITVGGSSISTPPSNNSDVKFYAIDGVQISKVKETHGGRPFVTVSEDNGSVAIASAALGNPNVCEVSVRNTSNENKPLVKKVIGGVGGVSFISLPEGKSGDFLSIAMSCTKNGAKVGSDTAYIKLVN